MDREARLMLETAVADLQDIARRLQNLVVDSEGDLKQEILSIQARSEAAVRYHSHLLLRRNTDNAPAIAQRVGLGTFGTGDIGLVPPQLRPNSTQ